MRLCYRLIAVTLIGGIVSACIDRIEFPLKKDIKQLVVYGQLTNLEEPHYLYLSETFSGSNNPIIVNGVLITSALPTPVKGAQVTLYDDQGNQFPYRETEAGKYELQVLTQAMPGVNYRVRIEKADQIYESFPQQLPPSLGADSAYYEITEDVFPSKNKKRLTHLLNVYAKTTLPETEVYLRWVVDEVYFWELTFFPNPFNKPPPDCYVFSKADPQRITLFNNAGMNSRTITNQVASREIDASFKNRHYFIVRQLSMNKDNYRYWNQVKQLIGNTGSVFDTPPAPISSNLVNLSDKAENVLGYFEVNRVTETRFFVVRGYIPYYLEPYCEYDYRKPYDEYPEECITCSKFPNSTGIPPPWF
jgi:hypothetical protein